VEELFLDILGQSFTAAFVEKEKKTIHIQMAIYKLDILKFFLQVGWETGNINNEKYIALSEPLGEVGKMLGGWYRQLSKTSAPERGGGKT
jgi:hypothetical protein